MLNTDLELFFAISTILALIFYTSKLENKFIIIFYKLMPVTVACYFLPSLLNTFNLINLQDSQLPKWVNQYVMPCCLCLLLIGLDIKTIFNSGRKLLILCVIGSLGIFLGGPFTLKIISVLNPELLADTGENSLWRGMATLSANWVGGTANQLAIKELFQVGEGIFAVFVTVNVLISGGWMTILLALAPYQHYIDEHYFFSKKRKAQKINPYNIVDECTKKEFRLVYSPYLILLILIALSLTIFSNVLAEKIAITLNDLPSAKTYLLNSPFMWKIILITTFSVGISFTSLKKLVHHGANKLGTLFLYFMLATMGLKMDINLLFSLPHFFVVGMVWILIYITILLMATYLMKLPFSYFAIASQCNIGGVASAPVVAGAYNKKLVPLSVLVAVFGYAWANFIASACGLLMQQLYE